MSNEHLNLENLREEWRFMKRWRIEGILFTREPFFIGSGEVMERADIDPDAGPVEVSECIKGCDGRPIIPGSSLKGCVRRWLETNCPNEKDYKDYIECVFGNGPVSDPDQEMVGSRVCFHDCPVTMPRTDPTPLPFFNRDTQTFIEAHTCMDRVSGTVAENKLFYQEVVPPGVGFEVVITGSCKDDREIGLVLAGLEGFCHADAPLRLGSGTHSGRGSLGWEPRGVQVMGEEEVKRWLSNPETMFFNHMTQWKSDEIKKAADKVKRKCTGSGGEDSYFTLSITLSFDSHFLVNDPPTREEKQEAERRYEKQKEKDPAVVKSDIVPSDFRPRKDHMGRVLLPATSFRGALRSQAERILKTIDKKACNPARDPGGGDNDESCPVVEKLKDLENLCLACRLFGAPGWRSPLEISDFTLMPREDGRDYEFTTQEFVAIDRFTGGGKQGAKFNACAIYRPVFTGTIRVDLKRLRIPKAPGADRNDALAVLALVLRDLIEGDITFGFGSSKGYGTCTATVDQWTDGSEFMEMAKKGLKQLNADETG